MTAKTNVLPPKVVTCGATATLPPSSPSTGVTCAPASPALPAGGGCAGQSACVPKVAPARLSIQHAGDVSCPSGGPAQRSVIGAPADLIDNRTCGSCSCSSTASSCGGAQLTGYDNAACTAPAVTVDVDGGCHFAASGESFTNNTHFVYSATPNTIACAPASATTPVGGSYVVNNPITLCCP